MFDGGREVALRDRHGVVRSWSYDDQGRLTQIADPRSGDTIAVGYNAANRLQTVTANGVTQTVSYDELNRLISIGSAAALDAGGLGAPLRAILPYHRRARAWLPESRALFAVAALADAAATNDPATWPALATQADPPGRLPGDLPGLGMTCSAEIQCPAEAPICVTASHDQAHGFCTRACIAADECDGAPGRCGLTVTDIPGVPRGVTACYLPCGTDGACPALLACAADFAGEPAVCAPP